MIPKIIHYCWFGRGKMPLLALECIKSWEKYLPDFEIRVWNEDNFDLNKYQYVMEAYEERKFAFVTDVCRLYALKIEGGIYMDSDVEILKPLDEKILRNVAFSGFEDNLFVPTGIMGSERNGEWVNDLLKYYDDKSFYFRDGTLNLTTNTQVITDFMRDVKGMIMNNSFQVIEGYCTMYPSDYFCPKSWETKKVNITPNTYCIHHFSGSWKSEPNFSFKYNIVKFFLGGKYTKIFFDFYQKIKK